MLLLGAVLLLALLVGVAATPTTAAAAGSADLYVNASNSSGTNTYATVGAAWNNSTSGDVIEVENGTYTEEATLNSSHSVTVRSATGATIQGSGGTLFDVNGDANVTVRGVGIDGYHRAIDGRGLRAAGSLTVRNVTVDGNSTYNLAAIDVAGSAADVALTGSEITGTYLGLNGDGAGGDWTIARTIVHDTEDTHFYAPGSSGAFDIRDSRFVGSNSGRSIVASFNGNAGSGNWSLSNVTIRPDYGEFGFISVSGTVHLEMRNTTIRGGNNMVDFNSANAGTDVEIHDSRLIDGKHGVTNYRGTGTFLLENVTVHTRSFYGVDAGSSDSDWTIRDSNVSDNPYSGIKARGATGDFRIVDTRITGNGYSGQVPSSYDYADGIHAADAAGNWTVRNATVTGNSPVSANFSGSTGDVDIAEGELRTVSATDATNVSTTNNWWGTDSGPVGSTTGNLTTTSYCLNADCTATADLFGANDDGLSGHADLQDAFEATAAGDTLRVVPGTSWQNTTASTNRSITLRPATRSDGTPANATIRGDAGTMATFEGDANVTVRNLTFRDYWTALDGNGLSANGTLTVRNTTVDSQAEYDNPGIEVRHSGATVTLVDSEITGSYTGLSGTGASGDWTVKRTYIHDTDDTHFFAAASSGTFTVEDSRFVGNDHGDGITASHNNARGSGTWDITNTTIETYDMGWAFWATNGDRLDVEIRNSTFRDGDDGIMANSGNRDIAVYDSRIHNATVGSTVTGGTGNLTFRNVSVTHRTGADFASDGIDMRNLEGSATFRNVSLVGAADAGVYADGAGADVRFVDSRIVDAAGAGFDGTPDGVRAVGTDGNWTFRDTTFRNNTGVSLNFSEATGDVVASGGELRDVDATNASNVTTTNNWWGSPAGPADSTTGNVTNTRYCLTEACTETSLRVEADGETTPGYESVSDALNASVAGDTVLLAEGVHAENTSVRVNDSVTLRSAYAPDGSPVQATVRSDGDAEQRLFDANGDANVTVRDLTFRDYWTVVEADDLTANGSLVVRNATLNGSGHNEPGISPTAGLELRGSAANVTVADTEITGHYRGIAAPGASGTVDITRTSIHGTDDTFFHAPASSGTFSVSDSAWVGNGAGEGVVASNYNSGGSGTWAISNVTLRPDENQVVLLAESGSVDVTVRNSTFRNGSTSIDASGSQPGTTIAVHDSRLLEGKHGISDYDGAGDFTLRNTTIGAREFYGIDAKQSASTWDIENSDVSNNPYSGIVARGASADFRIVDTRVANNGFSGQVPSSFDYADGIHAAGSSGNWTVRNATVVGNDPVSLNYNESSGNVDVTGGELRTVSATNATDVTTTNNWWGDNEGPYGKTTGTVTTVGYCQSEACPDWLTLTNATDGTQTGYKSLRLAVQDSTDGDTIGFSDGNYTSYATVETNKSLTFEGAGTTLYGDGGTALAPTGASNTTVRGLRMANYVTALDGRSLTSGGSLTVRNATLAGQEAFGHGAVEIENSPANLTMVDSDVSGHYRGIAAEGASGHVTLSGTAIHDTTDSYLHAVSASGTFDLRDATWDGAAGGRSVHAWQSSGDWRLSNMTVVNANTGENAHFYDSTADIVVRNTTLRGGTRGLVLDSHRNGNASVHDSRIVGANRGLKANYAAGDYAFENTTIRADRTYGVQSIESSATWRFENVNVSNNPSSGFSFRDAAGSVTIVDSRVVDNGGYQSRYFSENGIEARGASADIAVRNTTLTGNVNASVGVAGTSGNVSVTGGELQTLNATSAANVTTMNNWWGNDEGPIGSVAGSVTTERYCLSADCASAGLLVTPDGSAVSGYDSLDAAVDNGTAETPVLLTAGTHRVNTTVTVDANASVREAPSAARDGARPTVRGDGGTLFDVDGDANASVSGLELENYVTAVNGSDLTASGSIHLRDSTLAGQAKADRGGVEVRDSGANVRIERTDFTGHERGIVATGASGTWTVTGSDFRGLGSTAVHARGSTGTFTLESVRASNNGYGPGIAAGGDGASGEWTVRDSEFTMADNQDGVSINGANASLTLRNTTLRNGSRSVDAGGAGPGTNVTVRDSALLDAWEGIDARQSQGTYLFDGSTVDARESEFGTGDGIRATKSGGEWTVRNTDLTGNPGNAIRVTDAVGTFSVVDSRLTDNGESGLRADAATGNVTVRGTTFAGNADESVAANGSSATFRITGNDLRSVDATNASQVTTRLNYWGSETGPSDADLTGNVTAPSFCEAADCSETYVTVSKDGSDDGQAPYGTVASAIDAVSTDSTVALGDGTYRPAADAGYAVDKGVTVTADGSATVDAGGATGFTVSASGAGVEDLRVENASTAVDVTGLGTGTNVDVRGVTAAAAAGASDTVGIGASGNGASASVTDTSLSGFTDGVRARNSTGDWTVVNVSTTDSANAGVDADGSSGAWSVADSAFTRGTTGVSLAESSGDWEVVNTRATDNTDDGVAAVGTDGSLSLRDVEASDNGDDGVDATDADGSVILENTVAANNADTGLVVQDASGPVSVEGGSVAGNGDSGIDAARSSADVRVTNTSVTDNADTGINASAARDGLTVSGTTVTGNGGAGIDAANSSGAVSVVDANLSSNAGPSLVRNRSSAGTTVSRSVVSEVAATNASRPVNASDNWWGQAGGPPEGAISGNVETGPYCANANCSAVVDPTASVAGGGGGGGGQTGGDRPASVSVYDMNESTSVLVRDAPGGDLVTANVEGATDGTVTLRSVGVRPTFTTDQFRIEVGDPSPTPVDGPALEEQGLRVLSYFSVDHPSLADDRVRGGQIRFALANESLPEGTTTDDVVVHHYTDGEWRAVETTHAGDGEYVATTDGFSPFAVTVRTPTEESPTVENRTDDEATEAEPESESTNESASTVTAQDSPVGPAAHLVALLVGLALAVLGARRNRD